MLIEDDPAIASSLSRILESSGYHVTSVPNAADATLMLSGFSPSLIILDLALPDADGLLFLPSLRSCTDAPIIICSGRIRQVDRVLSLKMGADDFIAKPFDVDELEARIEAVLRRAAHHPQIDQPASAAVSFGDVVVSPTRGTVTIGGASLHLTPTEYRLLLALVEHHDELFPREALCSALWGYEDEGASHVIDVHIGRLREKLRRQNASVVIETVRGRGYVLSDGGQANTG